MRLLRVQRWLLFTLLTISAAALIQCEGEDEDPSQTQTPGGDSCSASGFTKIQASIADVCMNCHNEAKGGLTAAFDATTAQTNIDLLQAAGWTDGGELHNYVIGETKHGGATHSGATNSDVKDIPRTDYTPWCIE